MTDELRHELRFIELLLCLIGCAVTSGRWHTFFAIGVVIFMVQVVAGIVVDMMDWAKRKVR